MKPTRVKVAEIGQIKDGRSKVIFFNQKEVAIFNFDGNFYALENLCPHRKGPLSEGTIADGAIVCPWHGARFDLKTGTGLPGPHRCDVKSYAVEVEGTEIKISF